MKKTKTTVKSPVQKLREYLQAEAFVLQPSLTTKSKIKHSIINTVFWILNVKVDIMMRQVNK